VSQAMAMCPAHRSEDHAPTNDDDPSSLHTDSPYHSSAGTQGGFQSPYVR